MSIDPETGVRLTTLSDKVCCWAFLWSGAWREDPSGFPVFHDILLHFQTNTFGKELPSLLSDSESFRN